MHYMKVTDILITKLRSLHSESKYFLFMDELDEGYSAGDANLRLMLLALLRATEDIALAFTNEQIQCRPVVCLRSDIFDRLEDNDLNKLDDYLVRLRWSAKSEAQHSLQAVVNARINYSMDCSRYPNPWEAVVDNRGNLPRHIDTVWKYMYNRTFDRPRDIIKFLKLCQHVKGQGLLTFSAVQIAEAEYSNWFYNEFRDEINAHCSVWREVLQCLQRIGHGKITNKELITEIERDGKIMQWLETIKGTPNNVIQMLFEFGVIGNLSPTGTWLFKYKDEDLAWNPRHDPIVHYGFHKKLRIFRA